MTAQRLDVAAEVAALTAALVERRDPDYEAGMRRTVPSQQPAHATRAPEVRRVVADWRRAHRDVAIEDLYALCDALWQTGWREERLVAISLARRSRTALAGFGWQRVQRWSADIDNWEHVDHLADVSGWLLWQNPAARGEVEALSLSDNPWQRRLALVTLIVAFRQDAAWRSELTTMAARLQQDRHPLVRRAVVWARDRLAKDHIDG
jgi:3-methyladenine DNA glycosylase AlkD